MLHRLPRILRSAQQQSSTPRWCPHRQLIQRQTLPTGLLDACFRRSGETERRNGDFGHGEQARIVGDGTDYDEGFSRGG